jgi:hypothetical protein
MENMENMCDFGCGLPSIKIFKNGKKCCSENVNACPAKRKRDSDKKIGKNPWEGREHPRGYKGKTAWNKGKTLISTHGEERAKEINAKKSAALVGHTWITDEKTLIEFKKKASIRAYKRHADGWQGAIGRCKKIKYFSIIAGEVTLDGGWELLVAKYFDNNGKKWKRNKIRFEYINLDGNKRFYTPDFYLEDENIFIEVKGYETDLDRCKWKQFPEKIEIWKKEKIKEIKKYLKEHGVK